MDKHQRKRLRENDRYIGKRNDEVEKFFRTDPHIRDKRFLYETLRVYIPRFLSILHVSEADEYGFGRTVYVDGRAVDIMMNPFPPGGPYFWLYREPEPLLSRMKEEIEHPGWRLIDIVNYEWDLTEEHILLKESLKKFQHELDVENVRAHGPSFFRTTERTQELRKELMEGHARMQAILACKRLKEDLMAAAWHPRRVGYILETYGWEVYENLLVE